MLQDHHACRERGKEELRRVKRVGGRVGVWACGVRDREEAAEGEAQRAGQTHVTQQPD